MSVSCGVWAVCAVVRAVEYQLYEREVPAEDGRSISALNYVVCSVWAMGCGTVGAGLGCGLWTEEGCETSMDGDVVTPVGK
jgi:hypothetical protein